MMLYNMVDYPVMVTIGDKTYRMERDSELEVKISSGEYYLQIYKLDPRRNEPMRKFKTNLYPADHVELYRGKLVRSRRMSADDDWNSTVICYGVSALLQVYRNTKLYIREVFADELFFKISTERYFIQSFDLIVENGELNHRKDGCVDELTRKQLLRSIHWETGFSIFRNLFLLAGVAVLYYWLRGWDVEILKAYLSADLEFAIGVIVLPLCFAFGFAYDLFQFRKIKDMKELPLLPPKEEYDYL